MSDLYQEIILEELKQLRHQGTLTGEHVHSHHERNASCGDEVTVYLQLANKNNEQVLLKWQGQGCAISMVSMSLLAEKIQSEQLNPTQITKLQLADILVLLGLDEIAPGRLKCVLLGLTAVQKLLPKL